MSFRLLAVAGALLTVPLVFGGASVAVAEEPPKPALAPPQLPAQLPPALPTPPQPKPPAAEKPEPPKYDIIALTALKYVDLVEGQCWQFMKNVVLEATGREIGFDYREGFFEAGAEEVDVEHATSGDIIQVARDDNTAPDADYAGLHTAIILVNHGDGSFTVVDSNAQWDQVVRIREDYRPDEMAARYDGLNFHIYRIPHDGSVSPPPLELRRTDHPVAPDHTYAPGDVAVVAADGDCLNLRKKPTTASEAITCLPDRTELKVTGEPVTVGTRTWVPVTAGERSGFVAAEYIAPKGGGSTAQSTATSGGAGVAPVNAVRAVVPLVAGESE
jgi:hypothetical protein